MPLEVIHEDVLSAFESDRQIRLLRLCSVGCYDCTSVEIYYFKWLIVLVSTKLLAIVASVICLAMEAFMAHHDFFHYLNPHPFNEENVMIVFMSSAAINSALVLGYGIAGFM